MAFGTPEEVLTPKDLEKAYQIPAEMLKHKEDNALDIILRHELKQIDERHNIVAIVHKRLLNALAYGLRCCEVDDTLNGGVLLEYGLGSVKVAMAMKK